MLQFILEILLEIFISVPGGLIRWVLFRNKGLKEYIKDDYEVNAIVFTLSIIAILLLVKLWLLVSQ